MNTTPGQTWMTPCPQVSLEMTALPPQWVDAAESAREDLKLIKEKLLQLEKAQSKRLLRVFSDDQAPDREVERISSEISSLVKRCEPAIHQVKTRGAGAATSKDRELRHNMQRNLATQLQQLSQQFRQSQKDYLNDIRKRQKPGGERDLRDGMAEFEMGFTDSQLQDLQEMEQNASVRNEEITKIASSISDLHTIFKELAVLVIDQGSILDRIDYNIEQVVHQSSEANKQLRKAEESQKSNRAMKCIYFLVIINLVLILILILKARHWKTWIWSKEGGTLKPPQKKASFCTRNRRTCAVSKPAQLQMTGRFTVCSRSGGQGKVSKRAQLYRGALVQALFLSEKDRKFRRFAGHLWRMYNYIITMHKYNYISTSAYLEVWTLLDIFLFQALQFQVLQFTRIGVWTSTNGSFGSHLQQKNRWIWGKEI